MPLRRILIVCFALAVLAACSNGEDDKAKSDTERPSTTITADKPPAVIDPTVVERLLVQQFADRGPTLKSASCPDTISGTVGNESTCDVDFSDGAFGNVTIKIVDTTGAFEILGFNRSLAKPPGS